MMLSDYISLFTKKLKLIIDQIKTYWTTITMVSNTYTYTKTHIYKYYFISNYNNNTGIVGKIEMFNDSNRDCRVIGLLI